MFVFRAVFSHSLIKRFLDVRELLQNRGGSGAESLMSFAAWIEDVAEQNDRISPGLYH